MEHRDQLPGRPPRIPAPDWDTILDGQPWELRIGEDTGYTRSTFRTYAYKEATRRGGHARVITPRQDPSIIHIQFRKGPQPPRS